MTIEEINEKLRSDAIAAGLCNQWQADWKNDWDKDLMIEKYISGIDFSIKSKWITNKFIRDNFTPDELHRHNMYLDDEVHLHNAESGIYVFQGECNSSISFGFHAYATLHVRHDSKMKIKATGFSKVFVNVYESASVDVIQEDFSKVYIYTHSDENFVKHYGGNVFIKRSHVFDKQ